MTTTGSPDPGDAIAPPQPVVGSAPAVFLDKPLRAGRPARGNGAPPAAAVRGMGRGFVRKSALPDGRLFTPARDRAARPPSRRTVTERQPGDGDAERGRGVVLVEQPALAPAADGDH